MNSRVFALCVLVASASLALPKEGEPLAKATISDLDGHVFSTENEKGRPILIVYEDRHSGKQNLDLKNELGVYARDPKYQKAVALAAVADVSAYDFWPARGFVKSAIRKESEKANTPIYCDWNGAFREALQLTKGQSNIVLVGKSGKVLYVAAGPMGEGARKRLLDLLRTEVEG